MRVAMASLLVLLGTAAASDAATIDPRCQAKGVNDKIGCTCALMNGGQMQDGARNGMRWTYPRQAVTAFAACKANWSKR